MAFIIDAFDREIIAWTALSGTGHQLIGCSRCDAQGGREALRLDASTASHRAPVRQWSPYTAKETRDFALALNLVSCFIPVKSPESNGMSEAFVKTFKRDYLRVSPLPGTPTVPRQIAGWIDDYNEIHSHSALRMGSPREFIRAQTQ